MSPMVPMTERSENIGSVNVHQMMEPATPMTPMTPGSADPGILPQLQWVLFVKSLKTFFTYMFILDCIRNSNTYFNNIE